MKKIAVITVILGSIIEGVIHFESLRTLKPETSIIIILNIIILILFLMIVHLRNYKKKNGFKKVCRETCSGTFCDHYFLIDGEVVIELKDNYLERGDWKGEEFKKQIENIKKELKKLKKQIFVILIKILTFIEIK